jgi:transcription elongation factor Elf1
VPCLQNHLEDQDCKCRDLALPRALVSVCQLLVLLPLPCYILQSSLLNSPPQLTHQVDVYARWVDAFMELQADPGLATGGDAAGDSCMSSAFA